jgi:hypothetical protein
MTYTGRRWAFCAGFMVALLGRLITCRPIVNQIVNRTGVAKPRPSGSVMFSRYLAD